MDAVIRMHPSACITFFSGENKTVKAKLGYLQYVNKLIYINNYKNPVLEAPMQNRSALFNVSARFDHKHVQRD